MKDISPSISRSTSLSATLLLCVSLSLDVLAKDYKVEAVLFANTQQQAAYESTQYQPIAEALSEAETWFLEPSMLLEEVVAIDESIDYELISHFSWGQEALPTSEAAIFNILDTTVQGWIKVYASHLLFANLDLDFDGYRLTEKRRLKLDEKHFFDHPKFGILLQVSRLEEELEEDGELEQEQIEGREQGQEN